MHKNHRYEILAAFDFDNSLFNSPSYFDYYDNTNIGYDPKLESNFYSHLVSLTPPLVPETPGEEWWIQSTKKSALWCLNQPGIYSVIITGRPHIFEDRIRSLTQNAGMHFNDIFCLGSGKVEYKMRVIDLLCIEFPSISGLILWEDRFLDEFSTALKSWENTKTGRKSKLIPVF